MVGVDQLVPLIDGLGQLAGIGQQLLLHQFAAPLLQTIAGGLWQIAQVGKQVDHGAQVLLGLQRRRFQLVTEVVQAVDDVLLLLLPLVVDPGGGVQDIFMGQHHQLGDIAAGLAE